MWLGRRGRIRAPGLFALYVAGYSGFRIFEELLRVDPARHILGLRLNFYVAMLLFAAGLIWFGRIRLTGRRTRGIASRGGPAALGLAWVACSAIGCGNAHTTHRGAGAASSHAGPVQRGPSGPATGRLDIDGRTA